MLLLVMSLVGGGSRLRQAILPADRWRAPGEHERVAERNGHFLFTDIEGSTRLLTQMGESSC